MTPVMPDTLENSATRIDPTAPAGAAVGLSLELRLAQAGVAEEALAEIKTALRANGSGVFRETRKPPPAT